MSIKLINEGEDKKLTSEKIINKKLMRQDKAR